MSALRLGLCQWAIGRGGGVDAWAARLEAEVAHAAGQGGRLLVLPEYAPLELAGGSMPDLEAELAAGIAAAPAAIAAARAIAMRHGVWLLPGSLPFRDGDRLVNRAMLIAPDGRMAGQDKHVMTRFEDESWRISPGRPPSVFETPWGLVGIAICFDLEFPNLVRAQVAAGAWLILAPSCTDTIAGFNRVRIAAAARAMENQCFVGMAPTVGLAPWIGTLDENRGYAGVFGPVDRGFPEDGVIARGALDRHEWVFVDLDPADIARVRAEGAVFNHRRWPADPPACPVVVPA